VIWVFLKSHIFRELSAKIDTYMDENYTHFCCPEVVVRTGSGGKRNSQDAPFFFFSLVEHLL
jgi:hypothetical protein